MVEKSGWKSGHGVASSDMGASPSSLKLLLADAEAALRVGDTALAEHQAKAISALVRATRDVAELEAWTRAQAPEEDDEALRAEIRSRVARFVDAALSGDSDETLEGLAREAFEE